ncbi:MAG: hypothetical protein NVSMB32_01960 [Actinomycetota bacterium]
MSLTSACGGSPATISFVNHGVRFGVQIIGDPSIGQAVASTLPPGSRKPIASSYDHLFRLSGSAPGEGTGPATYRLCRGDALEAEAPDLDGIIQELASRIDFDIACSARRGLFVHAGVVAWQGRTILVPGRSFSGKSTLVWALTRSGATYWSDEYAILDPRGRVHPWPRPLSLRTMERTWQSLSLKSSLSYPGTAGLPVGLVVATRYRRGAHWRPRPMSAAEGVITLLDNTVSARARPRSVLNTLRLAVGGASVIESDRGHAERVAALILDLVRESSPGDEDRCAST